jgi:hypothetical protein
MHRRDASPDVQNLLDELKNPGQREDYIQSLKRARVGNEREISNFSAGER